MTPGAFYPYEDINPFDPSVSVQIGGDPLAEDVLYIPEEVWNDPNVQLAFEQALQWILYQANTLGVSNYQGWTTMEMVDYAKQLAVAGFGIPRYGDVYGNVPVEQMPGVIFANQVTDDPGLLAHFGILKGALGEDYWTTEGEFIGGLEDVKARLVASGQAIEPTMESWGSWYPQVRRPPAPARQGPPTPWFLEELTGLRAGQPIQPMPTKFASGRYLSRLTPSELQGLGGYINWSAGQVSGAPASYEDWLYKSQQLLPTSVPRGVTQWSPSPYWG